MADYTKSSPWAATPQNNFFLETFRIRPVPAESDDFTYDVYGNAKLWWVFVQRNMDVLKDAIYDFVPGTVIYLPKQQNLEQFLGV